MGVLLKNDVIYSKPILPVAISRMKVSFDIQFETALTKLSVRFTSILAK